MQTDIFRKYGAKAIWADNETTPNRYLRFQSEFVAEKGSKVLFCICAETKYELYINGSLAGFGQYEDFPQNKVYDECDISDYIQDGKNLVSILAYSQGEDSMQHISGLPMVIFAAVSDNKALLLSDENIKCSNAEEFVNGDFERITPQRSYNFGFDFRNNDGWRENNVSQEWKNAVICDDSKITYLPRPIKMLELKEICCGKIISQGEFSYGTGNTISEKMQNAAMAWRDKDEIFKISGEKTEVLKNNSYWIVDLGEETAGYITLDIEAAEGTVLDIACGEHLADMRVRSYVGGRNFAFSCICREGRQSISFYIKRLAGRYLQFFASNGIRAIYKAGLHEVEYPLSFEGKFCSNDRLFNKIYSVGLRTLKLCMHEHYEDCPQREQALYGMDSRNQMLAGYYAFSETAMPRASLELLAQGQLDSGLLEICAPAKFERTIPYFSLMWVIALKEYALFSGDLSFAKAMQKTARGVLDFFLKRIKNGLVVTPTGYENWNFYEWTDGMDNWDDDPTERCDAPLNCFVMMAIKDYAMLCGWLDDKSEQSEMLKVYDDIASAFHPCFYDEQRQAYKSYVGESRAPHFAQLTQALALLSGGVPENIQTVVREKLLDKSMVEASLSHMAFMYDALMQEPEKYSAVVLDDIERQWGYMLYNGATTFWETILGEADFDGAGSLCHGWSAVPVYIFWRYVLGIYPKEPGFKEIIQNPMCGKELKITAELKTPQGILTVSND